MRFAAYMRRGVDAPEKVKMLSRSLSLSSKDEDGYPHVEIEASDYLNLVHSAYFAEIAPHMGSLVGRQCAGRPRASPVRPQAPLATPPDERPMIDISRKGVSWLDITTPPPEGESWPSYLRRSQLDREVEFARSSRTYSEFKSRFVVFRFSYEMARMAVKDASMFEALKRLGPDDWESWFPKRLYGCACFRESRPGSLFVEYGGPAALVPAP